MQPPGEEPGAAAEALELEAALDAPVLALALGLEQEPPAQAR